MARNDVYLNINALSPADAVVTGQQDMTAATVPELVLGDTPTFNFYFTDNTNVWPSWAGNASYSLTWALSDAVAGDFAPAATTGNATPITGGWSVILPLNSYDLVGLLNTKRVGQPYPVTNLWQQLRVTDPSGNEITRAMFWTPVRYRAISDTQNTESASPTGGRFVSVNNVNTLTTPTAAQFYAANPVPTSALGTAANGELLIGNGTGFTKATLTAGSGVSITNGSGSITISATDGDITLDDGTAAAPSLKFTADTDTGIYRPSDNVVGISAGGVSRATFGATSAINGTTIPGSKTLVVTTDKLSALAATTSAELAGVISDETGSGALVFANTPTLVTPNIGAATGTSVNLSGAGTFGGNLTVSGTGTSAFSGAIKARSGGADEVGIGPYGTGTGGIYFGNGTVSLFNDANTQLKSSVGLSLAGNLTVSGTGTSSFASGSKLGVGTTSPGVTFVAVGAPATLNYTIGSTSLADIRSTSAAATNAGPSLTFSGYYQTSVNTSTYGAIKGILQGAGDGNSAAGALTFLTANGAGSLSEWARLTNSGNLLIGTTTDSGNGKFQLSTHTTSAGGIGFGTDTQLFTTGSGLVSLTSSTTWPTLKISDTGTGTYTTGVLAFGDGNSSARNVGIWRGASNSIVATGNVLNLGGYAGITFTTGGAQIGSQTTALTLDSSQRTILSGALRLNNAYTASAVVPTGYVTIQDSTGTTYKVCVLL